MIRLPPRPTRTDTLFPDTTLFRSILGRDRIADDDILRLADVNARVRCAAHIDAVDQPVAAFDGIDAIGAVGRLRQIGRAHVCTPVTNAYLVCRLLLEKKKTHYVTQTTITPYKHKHNKANYSN